MFLIYLCVFKLVKNQMPKCPRKLTGVKQVRGTTRIQSDHLFVSKTSREMWLIMILLLKAHHYENNIPGQVKDTGSFTTFKNELHRCFVHAVMTFAFHSL